MPLSIHQKKEIVDQVHHLANSSSSALIADCTGLKVKQLTALRNLARKSQQVQLKVVKNTLAIKALKDTNFSGLIDACQGQTLIAFSSTEPSACARLFRDFIKEYHLGKVRALAVGTDVYSGETLEQIAQLPTKEEAIAKLLAVMQAPVIKLLQTLQAPAVKLARTLVAVQQAKES